MPRPMNANESLAVPLLRDISTAVARERNVGKLLPQVLEIAEKRLGMVRGTIALLAGDELRIEASTRTLNAEVWKISAMLFLTLALRSWQISSEK